MSCAVPECRSNPSRKQNDDFYISFHRFPDNTLLKKKWLKAIDRKDWDPKTRRICSKHFSVESFINQDDLKWRRLKLEAIPTLLLPTGHESLEVQHTEPDETQSTILTKKRKWDQTPLQDITHMSQNANIQKHHSPNIQTFPKRQLLDHTRSSTSLQSLQSVESHRLIVEHERLKKRYARVCKISKTRFLTIKALREKNRRLRTKNKDLNTLLEQALKNGDIAKEQLLILESLKSNEVIKRFAGQKEDNTLPREYSLELKKFAVTLHFLSPKAYNFVREGFDKVLPHPKTISSWYKGINCNPGFTSESLEAIKLRVDNSDRTLYCSLIIDEMAIRRLIEWDGRKYYGYVNIGCELDSDSVPIAKEALTFMVTCINDTWKIPVGYFLIHSITAAQKVTLIEQCISLLKETGITVISLTYDGAANNLAMAGSLCGPSKTQFKCNGFDICLWPDPCHNIKLVRNTLGEKKRMIDGQGKIISWEYLEKLHKIQQEEQLHLGNKLKKDHVEFVRQKMKVRLATQLLSTSVADALQFCKDLEVPEFVGAEGTITFIRIFNNLFDVLNSRNMRAKGWKRATASFNFSEIELFFEYASTYIKQLKFEDGTNVVNSNRKTGFVGFLTCMESLKKIYSNILADHNSPLKYLCTYKLNQDHVELFFGAIRSLGGFNNNPSARMFQVAYKKLLVHAQFKNGRSGNCLPLECITVLNTSPKKPTELQNIEFSGDFDEKEEVMTVTDHDYLPQPDDLSIYSRNAVQYISGFVVRKLKLRLNCEICIGVLTSQENGRLSLIRQKNRGGLIFPSKDVVQVCELTEKKLRFFRKNNCWHAD